MSFWKSLFNNESVSASGQAVIPFGPSTLQSGRAKSSQASPTEGRIVFSKDRSIDLYELEELCDSVGWSRRPLRKVKKAIQHSFLVISMWEDKGKYRRLIGFARATSDHAFNATIWDVVIHPKFQGKGLGKALMRQIIKELRSEDISNITLFADPHVVSFYDELGFTPDPEGIKGMFWYPNSR